MITTTRPSNTSTLSNNNLKGTQMQTVRTMPKTISRSSKAVIERAKTSSTKAQRSTPIQLGYSEVQASRIASIYQEL